MSQAALPATLGLLLFCAGVYAMLAKRSISKTALGVVLCSYAAAFLAGLLSAGTPGGVEGGMAWAGIASQLAAALLLAPMGAGLRRRFGTDDLATIRGLKG